jgi:tagaturonate epimerase
MHRFALSVFQEAIKSYSVTTDLDQIPKLEELNDEELPGILDQDDSRQLLHITYEYLLNAKNDTGGSLFKDRLYHILTRYEEDYWALIERQIEKHLHSLGVKKKE